MTEMSVLTLVAQAFDPTFPCAHAIFVEEQNYNNSRTPSLSHFISGGGAPNKTLVKDSASSSGMSSDTSGARNDARI